MQEYSEGDTRCSLQTIGSTREGEQRHEGSWKLYIYTQMSTKARVFTGTYLIINL